MKNIGEILKLSQEFLAERRVEKPRRLAEEILAFVLKMKRMDLYLQFDKPIVEEELFEIREKIKRCGKGEPLEYVVGKVDFFGAEIQIDSRVLIPRPETEILVEKIAKEAKRGVLWDLCTGSGCIGIALKKANPELEVTLSDLSEEALQVAKKNAELNGVHVQFVQGDLLKPFRGQKADWIVCNPPYISEKEYLQLDPSVRDFEPKMALVSGLSGLEFYERLAEVDKFLQEGGKCFFEIGAGQKEALVKLFPNARIEADWANYPRFLFAKKI